MLRGGSLGARPTPWINKIYGFPEVLLPEQKKFNESLNKFLNTPLIQFSIIEKGKRKKYKESTKIRDDKEMKWDKRQGK